MSTDVKNPHVEEQFDNIKHADNDHKKYRGLVLENKMKILLISDSKTDISIAAMDVNIGDNRNPDDLPGLAHLCEHMLQKGSETYPLNDFDEYLSQNGGWTNAETSLNFTNYYFNIIPKKLEEALDRFAQFFIAPLFSENLIEKEINGAIHLEYKENLTNDEWRFIALETLSVKPDHPYSKFSLGNRETLSKIPKEKNINVRNRLLEFYETYYSANIMSLCVLGKESLDDLENMVVERFRNVKNKEAEVPMYSECPLKDDDFNTVWYYVPIHNFIELHISFSLPERQHEHRMEIQQISDMNNSYYEKKHRLSCDDISRIACLLHECPMEEIFSEQCAWRPDLIEELMEYFTPQNIRIHVAEKACESIANETEKWHGVKYEKKKIPEKAIKIWNHAGYSTDLKLPPKNEFIATKFDIKTETNVQKFPIIVKDTSFVRVWYKKDDVFCVPKATMIFHFVSPFAYMDPLSSNLTDIFVGLLRESLNEYIYIANLAGLEWKISRTKYGIELVIDGYDDKQRVLLERSMDQMINFKIDPKWFEIIKEYGIKYTNFDDIYIFSKTVNYLEMLLTEQDWLNDELLESTAHLSVDRLELFIPKLFSKMHVECLIYGNVTEMEATDIGELIEFNLKTRMPHIVPLLQKQLVLYRKIKLEDGCHVLFEEENKVQKTSSTIVYYATHATGLQSESNMLLAILNQIIKQPCYDILRTTEKLGYTVSSYVCIMMNGTKYLIVVVQGDHHPQNVEQRIDSFMDSMFKHISTMPEEQFDNHKKSLISSYLKAYKADTITSQSSLYWKEIESQEYNFDRVNIEVSCLKTITQQQLLNFFKENICSNARRKLSVHVMPTAMSVERNLPDTSRRITVVSSENEIKKFDDLISFKLSQSLYPLLEPIDKNFVRKGIKCF
ncbi:insulin-degrading enzyme-like isoform X2 [Temnothorax nylanderi]|uniref:insulin-degrading enzyme-like isoform X2 n=1 Tax=Temnothorax nylanderi TaxID=102681 RepID=UPI003A83ADE0